MIKPADKALIDARLAICKSCPMNAPTVCITCEGLDAHFQANLPTLTLVKDPALHVCQIDCLPGIVALACDITHLTLALVPRTPYPNPCWKKASRP